MIPASWLAHLPNLNNPPNLHHYLAVSTILFSIGMAGALMRRNPLSILLSVQLAFCAAGLSFVSFSAYLKDLPGQAIVIFVTIIAAAETAVGLTIALLIYRKKITCFGQYPKGNNQP